MPAFQRLLLMTLAAWARLTGAARAADCAFAIAAPLEPLTAAPE